MIRYLSLSLVLLVPSLSHAQSARIISAQATYDVFQDGKKGMIIHVVADVDNLQGQGVNVAAYFFFKNGAKLPAVPGAGKYGTPDGQVTTQQLVSPIMFPNTRLTQDLFIPYFELHAGLPGVLQLQYQVDLYQRDNFGGSRLLTRTGFFAFSVESNPPPGLAEGWRN